MADRGKRSIGGLPNDHIGFGALEYSTREIVVQAEAGKRRGALGQRVPLGAGIVGHVARKGQTAVYRVASPRDNALGLLLADSVGAIALPLIYAEHLRGVLYIESLQPAEGLRGSAAGPPGILGRLFWGLVRDCGRRRNCPDYLCVLLGPDWSRLRAASVPFLA